MCQNVDKKMSTRESLAALNATQPGQVQTGSSLADEISGHLNLKELHSSFKHIAILDLQNKSRIFPLATDKGSRSYSSSEIYLSRAAKILNSYFAEYRVKTQDRYTFLLACSESAIPHQQIRLQLGRRTFQGLPIHIQPSTEQQQLVSLLHLRQKTISQSQPNLDLLHVGKAM